MESARKFLFWSRLGGSVLIKLVVLGRVGLILFSGQKSLNAFSRWRKLITCALLELFVRLYYQVGSCFCQNLLSSHCWINNLLCTRQRKVSVHEMKTWNVFLWCWFCFRSKKASTWGQIQRCCTKRVSHLSLFALRIIYNLDSWLLVMLK